MGESTIPLALRDTPPTADNWVRLTGARLDGLPDGYHTGGAWHNQATGEVWKPLDARPGPDCPFHEPTREAEALALVAGEPGFPRNWRVETRSYDVGGETVARRWLVRRHATVIDGRSRHLTLGDALDVEQGLRALNRRGWGVNDAISVALDDCFRPFVLDLSNAGPIGRYEDEEYAYWLPFLRRIGYGWLADLRAAGRGIAHALLLWRDRMGYHNGHVYAGLAEGRPKRLPRGGIALAPQEIKREVSEICPQVRWWLVRTCEDGALPEATAERLGLMWAWSPIRRPDAD